MNQGLVISTPTNTSNILPYYNSDDPSPPIQHNLEHLITNQTGWFNYAVSLNNRQECHMWEWGLLVALHKNRKYGDLRTLAASSEWTDRHMPRYQTLCNAYSTYKVFGPDRIRPLPVTYSHHSLLTKYPLAAQEELLDWIERTQCTVEGLREEINRRIADGELADPKTKKGKAKKPPGKKIKDRIERFRLSLEQEYQDAEDAKRIPQEDRRSIRKEINALTAFMHDVWSNEDEARAGRQNEDVTSG